MKIAYKDKGFREESLMIIAIANDILNEYEKQGFDLTLRQLYYQFVARDILPNKQASYNRLGSIINDARLCGLIDWFSIVDRTRNLRSIGHFENPSELLMGAADAYALAMWEDQDVYVEVWIEKDALIGVIEGVCDEWDVPHFSCRGYVSQSEMWTAAMRMIRAERAGQQPIIIHLGDHDPSGIDMTRDIQDRMSMFLAYGVEVDRIALTYDQVEEKGCPPNPAKISDSRAVGYINKYGYE